MNDVKIIIQSIVKHQKLIIGPLALEQANKVSGLKIDNGDHLQVKLTSKNSKVILTELVKRYEQLFGRASVEVCRDAVREISPPVSITELPDILK